MKIHSSHTFPTHPTLSKIHRSTTNLAFWRLVFTCLCVDASNWSKVSVSSLMEEDEERNNCQIYKNSPNSIINSSHHIFLANKIAYVDQMCLCQFICVNMRVIIISLLAFFAYSAPICQSRSIVETSDARFYFCPSTAFSIQLPIDYTTSPILVRRSGVITLSNGLRIPQV
jgi:hypothetical protein